jgi:alcohol dehydrogenase, propanol-preferring
MASMFAQELDIPGPLNSAPLSWRQTSRPEPGPGQVVIEVASCGVCRSNLHMVQGDWVDGGVPAISPIIPGHEVTGRVVEVAADVDGFTVGDPVGVQPLWWTCEVCEFCTSGREQLCHRRIITGEHVNGGYAEFMLANAAHTYPVPDGLDLIDAAPLFCPGITGFGAVQKAEIVPGQTVAVFGLGGVGHMAVQFAVLAGAEVVAVGRNAEHLRVARELGASRTIDSTDPEQLAAIEDSAEVVLTFADADVVTAQALAALKSGGTLVAGVPLNVTGFHFNKAQTIKASILGNREQMRTVLALAASGQITTVVERFPMSEAAQALDLLAAGRLSSRAVLHN